MHQGLPPGGSGFAGRSGAARGFYRDAPLLICDEPTAALDARAEHLERGEVTEEGDHAALMALDGLYADLYSLQAVAYGAA